MLDAELVINALGRCGTETGVLVTLGVQVTSELLVIGTRHNALLIQQGKDTSMLAVDEIKYILVVWE